MNKKLQVFVSSTYTDLIEERQAAVQAILDAGHIPAGMELFKAGNESQLKTIYKWIDESDVYMLILGGRYGSIEPKSGKSYTQLEYEYALSKDIPVFAVVLSQSFLTNKINTLGLDKVMEQIAPDKYQPFKSLVKSKIIREVDDCKDIKIAIHSTLNNFIRDYDFVGWVKSSYKTNNIDNSHNNTPYLKQNSSPMSVLAIMPFYEVWSQDLYCIIKHSCENAKVNLINTDEINMLNPYYIYRETLTCIKEADIIIADITNMDPIVFYKFGFAYSLNKHVILISQPYCLIPIDTAKIRYLTYELSPSIPEEFQKNLTETINLYKD